MPRSLGWSYARPCDVERRWQEDEIVEEYCVEEHKAGNQQIPVQAQPDQSISGAVALFKRRYLLSIMQKFEAALAPVTPSNANHPAIISRSKALHAVLARYYADNMYVGVVLLVFPV
jgi:hypothetical protein